MPTLPDGYEIDDSTVQPAPAAIALPDGYEIDPASPQGVYEQGAVTGSAQGPGGAPQMAGDRRTAALLGSSALKGLAAAAAFPGDALNTFNNYIAGPTERAIETLAYGANPSWGSLQPLSFGEPMEGSANPLPTSAEVMPYLRGKGLIDRPDLVPQDNAEKYTSSAAEMLGNALPGLLTSGGIGPAARVASQAVGSGIGVQAISNLFPNSPYAQLFGSLAGAFTGNSLAAGGEKLAGTIAGNGSPIIQAYDSAGVTPRMVGDVTGSPTMRVLQNIGGNKGAQQTLDDFGNSVNGLANTLGASHTLQEAGQALQDQGQKWIGDFKKTSDQKWGAVNTAIGSDTPVDLTNTSDILQTIGSKAGNNASARSFLTTPLASDVKKIVDDATPQTVTTVNSWTNQVAGTPQVNSTQPLQWQTLSALRSRVGEYLEDPNSIADAGRAQAKMLYGALSRDMQQAAFKSGSGALSALQDANAFTAQGHDFLDNYLQPLLSKDPSAAASQALSSGVKGGETLQALRQNLPDATDELAAVGLRRQMAGQSNGAAGNAVSPSRWLANSDPARRLSPEAYQALYPSPDVQSKMGALDQVAETMRSTEQAANHSNTASHAAVAAAIPAAIEGARQGYEFAGLPGALGGLAVGGTSPFAIRPLAGAFTSSPALARFLAAPVQKGNFDSFGGIALPAAMRIPFGFAPGT